MTLDTIEIDAAEVEQLRADLASLRAQVQGQRTGTPADVAELAHLREQNAALREVNVRLGRAEAENDQLNRAITAIVGERDTARAEVREQGNELARLRRQLADCEAALVEANSARRLSNAEHLHQRLTAATLVIGRWQDWRYCPLCREITEVKGARHACGRMAPVDVIIARRPNPPTTEEQP